MLWFDKHRQDKRMLDGRAKVVIVGAGFGGMEAAKSLSRAPVEVTVIDRQNHHCFQPLPLKQAWLLALVWNWQCAPKARIISGGRIHPESCRLIR